MKVLKNKKGIIKTTVQMLDELTIEQAKLLYGNIYPIHINDDYATWNGIISIRCYSEHFYEISEGSIIPEYVAVFTQQEDEAYKIHFEPNND